MSRFRAQAGLQVEGWDLWVEGSRAHCSVFGVEGEGPGFRVLLRRNAKRFREGLVFKAHRLVHHSTLGLRVTKENKKKNFRVERTGLEQE